MPYTVETPPLPGLGGVPPWLMLAQLNAQRQSQESAQNAAFRGQQLGVDTQRHIADLQSMAQLEQIFSNQAIAQQGLGLQGQQMGLNRELGLGELDVKRQGLANMLEQLTMNANLQRETNIGNWQSAADVANIGAAGDLARVASGERMGMAGLNEQALDRQQKARQFTTTTGMKQQLLDQAAGNMQAEKMLGVINELRQMDVNVPSAILEEALGVKGRGLGGLLDAGERQREAKKQLAGVPPRVQPMDAILASVPNPDWTLFQPGGIPALNIAGDIGATQGDIFQMLQVLGLPPDMTPQTIAGMPPEIKNQLMNAMLMNIASLREKLIDQRGWWKDLDINDAKERERDAALGLLGNLERNLPGFFRQGP